uniref:Uncharacterized protein n=1 Tax=Oryza brachyantha TaxID=4533 RepID=J3LWA5_ORYBR
TPPPPGYCCPFPFGAFSFVPRSVRLLRGHDPVRPGWMGVSVCVWIEDLWWGFFF